MYTCALRNVSFDVQSFLFSFLPSSPALHHHLLLSLSHQTGKKGEKPAAFFTTNLLATALSTAEVAKADRIKMAKAKARAAAAARGEE